VLGVAPRGFQGTEIFYRPDVWIPMALPRPRPLWPSGGACVTCSSPPRLRCAAS
jgi:hypothetical protein